MAFSGFAMWALTIFMINLRGSKATNYFIPDSDPKMAFCGFAMWALTILAINLRESEATD